MLCLLPWKLPPTSMAINLQCFHGSYVSRTFHLLPPRKLPFEVLPSTFIEAPTYFKRSSTPIYFQLYTPIYFHGGKSAMYFIHGDVHVLPDFLEVYYCSFHEVAAVYVEKSHYFRLHLLLSTSSAETSSASSFIGSTRSVP